MERIHVSVRSRPLSTEDAMKSPWKISSLLPFGDSTEPSLLMVKRTVGRRIRCEAHRVNQESSLLLLMICLRMYIRGERKRERVWCYSRGRWRNCGEGRKEEE
ncbi:Uncharacterized protein Rs2_00893 [Raphanus sativus]|nr:Uncharacterized protein Rs2_00893 [Raphanus sativus]